MRPQPFFLCLTEQRRARRTSTHCKHCCTVGASLLMRIDAFDRLSPRACGCCAATCTDRVCSSSDASVTALRCAALQRIPAVLVSAEPQLTTALPHAWPRPMMRRRPAALRHSFWRPHRCRHESARDRRCVAAARAARSYRRAAAELHARGTGRATALHGHRRRAHESQPRWLRGPQKIPAAR